MENETEKIFTEQLGKLPQEVVTFISSTSWDTDLDEIGELYNLSPDEILAFKREVTLVLVGLVHPDALAQMLDEEVGIKGAVLEALVANVEKKIFSTVRPALITFFESETQKETGKAPTVVPVFASTRSNLGETESGAISLTPSTPPDNLPTDIVEVEQITPLIIPQKETTNEDVVTPTDSAVHPFEEKMKRVFTAGNQKMNELVIKTPEPQTIVSGQFSAVPPIPGTDPYREPIE